MTALPFSSHVCCRQIPSTLKAHPVAILQVFGCLSQNWAQLRWHWHGAIGLKITLPLMSCPLFKMVLRSGSGGATQSPPSDSNLSCSGLSSGIISRVFSVLACAHFVHSVSSIARVGLATITVPQLSGLSGPIIEVCWDFVRMQACLFKSLKLTKLNNCLAVFTSIWKKNLPITSKYFLFTEQTTQQTCT